MHRIENNFCLSVFFSTLQLATITWFGSDNRLYRNDSFYARHHCSTRCYMLFHHAESVFVRFQFKSNLMVVTPHTRAFLDNATRIVCAVAGWKSDFVATNKEKQLTELKLEVMCVWLMHHWHGYARRVFISQTLNVDQAEWRENTSRALRRPLTKKNKFHCTANWWHRSSFIRDYFHSRSMLLAQPIPI